MTRPMPGAQVAAAIEDRLPGSTIGHGAEEVHVLKDRLLEVSRHLYEEPALAFDYLVALTSVDYLDYFEVVYRLVSLRHNHSLVVKTRAFEREDPAVPSVVSVWRGAQHQEREVYDLMGVRFLGHPELKRIFLWEGFEGHPLRKDFLLQQP